MNRREELIRKGLNCWMRAKYRGILNYATGVGKTFAAILAVEFFLRVYPKEKILIVCPTLEIIDNTKKEFRKFNKTRLLKSCKFICYASIGKEVDKYSLVVFDEIHHLVTDKRMVFFNRVSCRGILGLTASLSFLKTIILRNKGLPIVDKLNLEDVGDEGFISDYSVINYPVELTESELKAYKACTNGIEYARSKGGKSWRNISRRVKILQEAANKDEAVSKITPLFGKQYGILFSLTKDRAERYSEIVGETAIAIHSGYSKSQRRSRLKKFKDRRTKIRIISAPKIYDEGVTLPGLSFGLLVSRYSKERQFIQSLGRLLRNEDGKHAVAIRIYVKDTVEENWVRKSQKGFNNVVNVNTYEELKRTVREVQGGNV